MSLDSVTAKELIVELRNDMVPVSRALNYRAADEIDRLAGEVERLRGEDWQPIETAPKDGTPILICGGLYDWDASWGETLPFTGVTIASWHSLYGDQKPWRGENCGGHDEYYRHAPTHWKPLPKPFARAALEGMPPEAGTTGGRCEQTCAQAGTVETS